MKYSSLYFMYLIRVKTWDHIVFWILARKWKVVTTPPLQPTTHLPFADYPNWQGIWHQRTVIHTHISCRAPADYNQIPINRRMAPSLVSTISIQAAYSSSDKSVMLQPAAAPPTCTGQFPARYPRSFQASRSPGSLRPGAVLQDKLWCCAACSFCDCRPHGQSSARLHGLLHLYHALLLFTSGNCCTGFLLLCKYISPCTFLFLWTRSSRIIYVFICLDPFNRHTQILFL